MKLKDLFKRKPRPHYTFLCKSCDIFFDDDRYNPYCPMCNKKAETWHVVFPKEKDN